MSNLSKRGVDAVKRPAAGLVDTWDGAIPGYHLRTYASGRQVYRLKYRAGGRQRVITLGVHGDALTAEQARQKALKIWTAVMDGRDPLSDKLEAARAAEEGRRRAVTVSQLAIRYQEEGPRSNPSKRASSWKYDEMIIRRHVVPVIGEIRADALTRADVESLQAAVRAGKTAVDERTGFRGRARVTGGERTARAAVIVVGTMFSWGAERGLVKHNPAKGVKMPPPRRRERFLSEAEVGRLLDTLEQMTTERALSPGYADALRLLLLTGARKMEILALKWSEVDFERAHILLSHERGKRGERMITLNAPARQILSARERTSEYVFPSASDPERPSIGLQKGWRRVQQRASLEGVRIHDLRHSFASFGAAGGASLLLIKKALGHRQAATAERYAHLGADPVRAFAESVGEKIMESRSPKVEGGEVLPLRRLRP